MPEDRIYPDNFVMCSQEGGCSVLDKDGNRTAFDQYERGYESQRSELNSLSKDKLIAKAEQINVESRYIDDAKFIFEMDDNGDRIIPGVPRKKNEIKEKLIDYIEAKNIRDYIINRDIENDVELNDYSGYIASEIYAKVGDDYKIIETNDKKLPKNIMDMKVSEISENTSTFFSDFQKDYSYQLYKVNLEFEKENVDQSNIMNNIRMYLLALIYHLREKDNLLYMGVILIILSFFIYLFNISIV